MSVWDKNKECYHPDDEAIIMANQMGQQMVFTESPCNDEPLILSGQSQKIVYTDTTAEDMPCPCPPGHPYNGPIPDSVIYVPDECPDKCHPSHPKKKSCPFVTAAVITLSDKEARDILQVNTSIIELDTSVQIGFLNLNRQINDLSTYITTHIEPDIDSIKQNIYNIQIHLGRIDNQITDINSSITESKENIGHIISLIPDAATPDNKLTDAQYVNDIVSSIIDVSLTDVNASIHYIKSLIPDGTAPDNRLVNQNQMDETVSIINSSIDNINSSITNINSSVSAILNLIPDAASPANKLTDKAYVDSSIENTNSSITYIKSLISEGTTD